MNILEQFQELRHELFCGNKNRLHYEFECNEETFRALELKDKYFDKIPVFINNELPVDKVRLKKTI